MIEGAIEGDGVISDTLLYVVGRKEVCVIPPSFHDFFMTAAGASGALVGLLFVAMSVSREESSGAVVAVANQVRASSALTALVAPLLISLIALIPGNGIGVAATIVGGLGLLFAVSSFGRITRTLHGRDRLLSISLLAGFLIVMTGNVACGIALIIKPDLTSVVGVVAGTTVASLSIGIERAWELVGGVRPGAVASIQGLIVRDNETQNDEERESKQG